MTQALSLSESAALELVAAEVEARCCSLRDDQLPGRVRRAGAHASAGAPGHPGAVPGHRASLPADARLSRRARQQVGTESDHSSRRRTGARVSGNRTSRPAAASTKWSRSSARSSTTTRGSPDFAATSPRPGRRSSPSSRSRCRPAGRFARSALWRTGARRTSGRTPRRIEIPLLPLYELGYTSIGCEPCTVAPAGPVQRSIRPLEWTEARVRDPLREAMSW